MSPSDDVLWETNMLSMRRIQYHQYGGADVMRLEEFESASPRKGEVLVRVRAAAANPMDWKIRNGDVKFLTGRRFPRGLGHDFAGVIEAVGDRVTKFVPGDAVFGATSVKAAGAFAELVVADENEIVMKPPALSFEQAAVLPIVGVTAWQALVEKGRLGAGQSVFISGSLGGVGRAATQIAVMQGASAGGSCRPGKEGEARALGLDPLVNFDFDPVPLRGSFDVVFDTAGTLPLETARTLLKPRGRIVDINGSAAKMARSVSSRDFKVLVAKIRPGDLERVARAAAEGHLTVPIAHAVPLGEAVDALTELECTHAPRSGKLVVVMQ